MDKYGPQRIVWVGLLAAAAVVGKCPLEIFLLEFRGSEPGVVQWSGTTVLSVNHAKRRSHSRSPLRRAAAEHVSRVRTIATLLATITSSGQSSSIRSDLCARRSRVMPQHDSTEIGARDPLDGPPDRAAASRR